MVTRAARLPRLNAPKDKGQQQLIRFDFRDVGFLMPIAAVHRVLVFERGAHPLKYLNFENEILPVVFIDQHIISPNKETHEPSRKDPSLEVSSPNSQQQIALIIQAPSASSAVTGRRITLPIDAPPSLCRIADSDLLPLPKIYDLQYVDGITNATVDQPLRFLLNPNKLVEAQATAPSPST